MTVTFEKVDDLSEGLVQYYTAFFGENLKSEFQMFEEKDFPKHQEELDELYGTIQAINIRGAKTSYFKDEGPAFYLPNVDENLKAINDIDFGIRLYCIIPLHNVVILLNGDIKTKWKPEDCPNVRTYSAQAIKLAKKLNREIQSGNLKNETDLTELDIDL